jgi:REG-2-like HAD superfamily hydrolase
MILRKARALAEALPPARALHAAAAAANLPAPRAARADEAPPPPPRWAAAKSPPPPPPAAPAFADALRPRFRALLVDAAGTLLMPAEDTSTVYLRYARRHGCTLTEPEIRRRFRAAYAAPYGCAAAPRRYVGDARPFWRAVLARSTGVESEEFFEEVYQYYSAGSAYKVSPGAVEALRRIRGKLGLKTAVVSNFDLRLRRILDELELTPVFDAIIVSAEIGAEKPSPLVFEAAAAALGVEPSQCVHLGDDRRNDVFGARDAGCFAWLWGQDCHNFAEVERRLETGNFLDSLADV